MTTMEHTLIELTPVVPILSVSESASSHLQAMMSEKQLDGYALRVYVSGGGCSGLEYGMTFDDETREGDSTFTAAGLRVVVDSISAGYLTGASIDYINELNNNGFKIDNPNAVSSCGCGKSFRTSGDAEADDEAGGGCGGGGGCAS
ncbi:MAG: iron-sulfur cluster insertion protein ErpA [Chloroflexales bacterium]